MPKQGDYQIVEMGVGDWPAFEVYRFTGQAWRLHGDLANDQAVQAFVAEHSLMLVSEYKQGSWPVKEYRATIG